VTNFVTPHAAADGASRADEIIRTLRGLRLGSARFPRGEAVYTGAILH
jgi:hypothetical protein